MSAPDKPGKKLAIEPGESPWLALAREIAANPDGPIALQAISGMNRMLRPRELASQRLVEALARNNIEPGELSIQGELEAAKAGWESTCDAPLDQSLLAQFEKDALDLIERRKTQPPTIESILGEVPGRTDYGYALAVDLGGLRGTWHRLWACISMERLFDTDDVESTVGELRTEFEQFLGRPINQQEWAQLVAHAHHHCDTVAKPRLDEFARESQTRNGPEAPGSA